MAVRHLHPLQPLVPQEAVARLISIPECFLPYMRPDRTKPALF